MANVLKIDIFAASQTTPAWFTLWWTPPSAWASPWARCSAPCSTSTAASSLPSS